MDSYGRRVVVELTVWMVCVWIVALVVIWYAMPAYWVREAQVKTRVMLQEIDRDEVAKR